MRSEILKKIVVAALFAILLCVPFGMKKYEEWAHSEIFENMDAVMARYGFYLEDVTEASGVNFTHRRAVVDEKLHHILPQVSSMGASVSVTDFNKDGMPDIYLTNSEFGSMNALYKNLGDGTFEDVAGEMGVAGLNTPGFGASMGSVWADYNNDGYEDLLLYRWGSPELFRNDGGEGFTRVTEDAGLSLHVNANTAMWLDYNNDGAVDLFIGGYYHEEVNLFDLEHTQMMPDSYEYATNGGLNYLFENRGDGTFRDVSAESGIQETRRWTLAAASADIDGSGYPDIVIANDYGADEILINDAGNGFRPAGEASGLGFVPKSGMSVAFGDILNQGVFSIYITNISEPGFLMQGNNLWAPSRGSEGQLPRYRNVASNMGVEAGEWGYGGQFMDINNDGNLDLYISNGYISAEPGTDYWYDYAKVVGGNRAIIMDAKNWPAMNNRTFSGYQANKIWLNDGAGRFREVAAAVGGTLNSDSRAVAYADLSGTGSMDLIVANQHQPVTIFKNHTTPDHQWIGFDLEGTESNKSAIGAVVTLFWDGKKTKKIVGGGDAFSSQSQRPLHFGLGTHTAVEKAEIRWPSGRIQVIESPEPNRYHEVEEVGVVSRES